MAFVYFLYIFHSSQTVNICGMPVCAVVLDAMSPPSDVLVVLVGQRRCPVLVGSWLARRRLPALLRLGWGLGGRRRGRALVARTDFSPLDIAH